MTLLADYAIAALLVLGGVFGLIGSFGLLKLKDPMQRLHAPTKATTLGVGGVLLASLFITWSGGGFGLHEVLITLFVFITAPVSANLLAQAALHLRVPSKAGDAPPVDGQA